MARREHLASPVLLLVLPQLVDQWCDEILKIAPKTIALHKYYGDNRTSRATENPEYQIQGVLHPLHPIFYNVDPTKISLIISTPATFNKRHPAGKKTRKQEAVASDLARKFQIIIFDEGHQIKDSSSQIHSTIRSLDADFHILATATPIPNGVEDFKAYMPLLESRSVESWKVALPKRYDYDTIVPYLDVFDDIPKVSRLRVTAESANDCIFTSATTTEDKGRFLGKIWEKVLIRRTAQSRIPFHHGKKISNDMPGLCAFLVKCVQTEEEAKAYDDFTTLLYSSKETTQGFALTAMRSEALASMSLQLLKLSKSDRFSAGLKANGLRKLLANPTYAYEWYEELTGESLDPNQTDATALGRMGNFLVKDSAKLRTFLQILKTSVRQVPATLSLWQEVLMCFPGYTR